jgi:hypothetical protein
MEYLTPAAPLPYPLAASAALRATVTRLFIIPEVYAIVLYFTGITNRPALIVGRFVGVGLLNLQISKNWIVVAQIVVNHIHILDIESLDNDVVESLIVREPIIISVSVKCAKRTTIGK